MPRIARCAEPPSPQPIPVIIVDPRDPAETPDPVCSVCSIVTKPKRSEDSSVATLTLKHEGDFEGDVEVVVWFGDGERAKVWVRSVTIVDGTPVELELELESGEQWEWDSVLFAWTRFYAAEV